MKGKAALTTKEKYIQMYQIDKLSARDIAKKLGCEKTSVLRNMKKLGIPIRTVGEALKDRIMPAETRSKISKAMKIIQQGSNHSSWKGGRILHSSGYIHVWVKKHPFANPKGYVFEHRLVVEKILNRYLKPEEVVHHIDMDGLNNDPDNLMLCKDNSEHLLVHSGKIPTVQITQLPDVVGMADHQILFSKEGILVK